MLHKSTTNTHHKHLLLLLQGAMLGDQRHGQGTHTTSTGDVYTGTWQYDSRHGQGTFRAASGMVYQGTWLDDKATG